MADLQVIAMDPDGLASMDQAKRARAYGPGDVVDIMPTGFEWAPGDTGRCVILHVVRADGSPVWSVPEGWDQDTAGALGLLVPPFPLQRYLAPDRVEEDESWVNDPNLSDAEKMVRSQAVTLRRRRRFRIRFADLPRRVRQDLRETKEATITWTVLRNFLRDQVTNQDEIGREV